MQLLAKFHLDEFAIEAEAIRSVLSELEMLDKMLTLQESRRNKALRSIADYRDGLAKQVREVSNRVIESDGLIKLKRLPPDLNRRDSQRVKDERIFVH